MSVSVDALSVVLCCIRGPAPQLRPLNRLLALTLTSASVRFPSEQLLTTVIRLDLATSFVGGSSLLTHSMGGPPK